MKAVIFGAGNIGRGLVGEALADSGFTLTYVDADPGIVELLTERGKFDVVSSEAVKTVAVEAIVDASDEASVRSAIADADLVATAVGAQILKIVAPVIGAGLLENQREHVNVIACENVHPNSAALRQHIADAAGEEAAARAGFPNVVVDRIVPGEPGAADVMVEAGFEFVIDRNDWRGAEPDPTPIVFTSNLAAYKLRKLWLVNGLHVLTAWLGLQRDYEFIHEAIADPEVAAAVASAGSTAARALASQSDEFDVAGLEAYCASSLERFTNSTLPDLAVRVARNPLPKLATGERVMGPATAGEELNLPTDGFAKGIVAGLALDDASVAGASELRDAVERVGWDGVVVDHGGVRRDGPLFSQIETEMQRIEHERGGDLITEEVVITNPSGLHARPAAEIVEFAKNSEAQIHIHKGEKAANAKSIMSVLALGANTGDTVTIVADGSDASDVVAGLRDIMLAQEH